MIGASALSRQASSRYRCEWEGRGHHARAARERLPLLCIAQSRRGS
jgi:hypothetical protein